MKYIIKSLIYVSTTNIYWSIKATCFDLLTGHHQAISRVSQRCCLDTGIPIFTIFYVIINDYIKYLKYQMTTHILTCFNQAIYVQYFIHYQILYCLQL